MRVERCDLNDEALTKLAQELADGSPGLMRLRTP
jgi:hypothetical protein